MHLVNVHTLQLYTYILHIILAVVITIKIYHYNILHVSNNVSYSLQSTYKTPNTKTPLIHLVLVITTIYLC